MMHHGKDKDPVGRGTIDQTVWEPLQNISTQRRPNFKADRWVIRDAVYCICHLVAKCPPDDGRSAMIERYGLLKLRLRSSMEANEQELLLQNSTERCKYFLGRHCLRVA
jgi:hypothetical protein